MNKLSEEELLHKLEGVAGLVDGVSNLMDNEYGARALDNIYDQLVDMIVKLREDFE